MAIHPRKDEQGKVVTIKQPHTPTQAASWADPHQAAVAVPDGPMPGSLHRIRFTPWVDAPTERGGWLRLANTDEIEGPEFDEPAFDPMGMPPASGAVIVEPDGRVWLVAPSNAFGGYKATFPKGKTNGRDMRETAIKEVFEESGLKVELFGHLIDITKTGSRTRYYLARRRSGTPADMGWESQAAMLVPLEDLKAHLNQTVDHAVVDALVKRWGEWAGWFFNSKRKPADAKTAGLGLTPARKAHWPTLPMPNGHTTVTLDIHLNREEAECLKLGFIPKMQEQKWFAYFKGLTLFEHRSWTGFCRSQVHFVKDGEGLRATHAEVNRTIGQYSGTNDREDQEAITTRVYELARLKPEDRKMEDPFVAGLKQSFQPNYLGSPDIVKGLMEPFFQALIARRIALATGQGFKEACKAVSDENHHLSKVFSGEEPGYTPIGTWNSRDELGAAAIQALNLDPDYCSDESLYFVLSEGICGVSIAASEMIKAFDKDFGADKKDILYPQLGRLIGFLATVLMGSHSVAFPGLTLKDFVYQPWDWE